MFSDMPYIEMLPDVIFGIFGMLFALFLSIMLFAFLLGRNNSRTKSLCKLMFQLSAPFGLPAITYFLLVHAELDRIISCIVSLIFFIIIFCFQNIKCK